MSGGPIIRSVEEVAEGLEQALERIRHAGGHQVVVVAVTKGFDRSAIDAARAVGLADLGENYAQDLAAKAALLSSDPLPDGDEGREIRWHMIGQLQRNKVRKIAGLVSLWQSVDRADLIDEIAARSPGASILLQVNLSGEEHKGGCARGDLDALAERALEVGLDLQGLMGVGPAGSSDAARPPFRQLVADADRLGLPVRSIGMSADLEAAVSEGATMVRLGRDLFGPRSEVPPRPRDV